MENTQVRSEREGSHVGLCGQQGQGMDPHADQSEAGLLDIEPELQEPPTSTDQNKKHRGYCFTVNNYNEDDWLSLTKANLHPKLKAMDYIVAGQEVAPTTGTKHIQGYIHFTTVKKFSEVVTLFKRHLRISTHPYVAGAMGTAEHNRKYCLKSANITHEWGKMPFAEAKGSIEAAKERGKRNGERKELNETIRLIREEAKAPHELAELVPTVAARYPNWVNQVYNNYQYDLLKVPDYQLYKWQDELLSFLIKTKPKTRSIIWVWSPESNTGKTTFFTEVVVAYLKQSYLRVDGLSYKDILCAYQPHIKVIHLNLSRDPEPGQDKILSSMLEKLSDLGPQFSGKYGSTNKIVNAHICVTANVPPPAHMLPERFYEVRVKPDGSALHVNHTSSDYVNIHFNLDWVDPEEVAERTLRLKRKREGEEILEKLQKRLKFAEMRARAKAVDLPIDIEELQVLDKAVRGQYEDENPNF